VVIGAPISDDAAASVVADRNAANAVVEHQASAGSNQATGCANGDKKLAIGDTYVTGSFKNQCMPSGKIQTVACISNGAVEIPVGTTKNDGKSIYNCYENPSGAFTFFITDTTNLGLGVIQGGEFVKQDPKPYGNQV